MSAVEQQQRAQIVELSSQLQESKKAREVYARVVAMLVMVLKRGGEYAMGGEHIMLPLAELNEVPKLFNVELVPTIAKEEGEEDAVEVPMMTVKVTKKEDGNGAVEIPQRPRIVLP